MTRTAPPRRRAGRPVTGPRLVLLLGPAFVAAIAYVDPGNVAANLTAGDLVHDHAGAAFLAHWVRIVRGEEADDSAFLAPGRSAS